MIDWEIDEFACMLCGLSEEETEAAINDYSVDAVVWDKLDMDYEQFVMIVKMLLPYTPTIKSALQGKEYHAFVKDNCMLVRSEVKSGDN